MDSIRDLETPIQGEFNRDQGTDKPVPERKVVADKTRVLTEVKDTGYRCQQLAASIVATSYQSPTWDILLFEAGNTQVSV
jgi:hypothetical protein